MTNVFSYLITMLGIIFWVFRVIVAAMHTLSLDFAIQPLDENFEIIVLFVTLFSMILIFKRNIIGALIYFLANGFYFGTDFYNRIIEIMNGQAGVMDYTSLFISFVGVLIPFLTVMDILLNKERKGLTKDKKTDWFYTNKEYERKFDDRADRNQYKF